MASGAYTIRSGQNELERKFPPARFASHIQHPLVPDGVNGRLHKHIKLILACSAGVFFKASGRKARDHKFAAILTWEKLVGRGWGKMDVTSPFSLTPTP